MNFSDFRDCAEDVAAWIEKYFDEVEEYPVTPCVSPGELSEELSKQVPEEGVSLKQIFSDFESQIVPGLTHWAHPGFFKNLSH